MPTLAQIERHLSSLRNLLSKDYLSSGDIDGALQDLATLSQQSLQAREAFVVVRDHANEPWSGWSGQGVLLRDRDIKRIASRSVLEIVAQTGEPYLTSPDHPLDVTTESIVSHGIGHVLAAPLWFWDTATSARQQRVGGCVYLDRNESAPPFDFNDAELLLDITRIAAPILNLLRHLRKVEGDLKSCEIELSTLREEVAARYQLGDISSSDPLFGAQVLQPLQMVARHRKADVLLLGPTGSGKSHLARCFHFASTRKDGPFITLDCSQVGSAETLLVELFGYAPRSGYANAPPGGRPGKAEMADGGTLFIDEIGTLPAELQRLLLRLIQEGEFSRLGSSETRRIDVQVVTATNEDLSRRVQEGQFREDLYWRLKEITLKLPPLSDRPSDIPPIARRLLKQACKRLGRKDIKGFAPEAMDLLVRYNWARQGNIRGLQHTINRSVIWTDPGAQLLAPEHLQLEPEDAKIRPRAAESNLGEAAPLSSFSASATTGAQVSENDEEQHLTQRLRLKISEHEGNVSSMATDPEVARLFGSRRTRIPASTLTARLKRLGLFEMARETRDKFRTGPSLQEIKNAIQAYESGTAAAKALGITRHSLVARLRTANLTIREIKFGQPEVR